MHAYGFLLHGGIVSFLFFSFFLFFVFRVHFFFFFFADVIRPSQQEGPSAGCPDFVFKDLSLYYVHTALLPFRHLDRTDLSLYVFFFFQHFFP